MMGRDAYNDHITREELVETIRMGERLIAARRANGLEAKLLYTAQWLRVWVLSIYCGEPGRHQWGWSSAICERCGLTQEEAVDHSWSWRFPRGSMFVWRGLR